MNRPKYVASCSGGKDSVATLLLAAQHNEPLDEAVFSEVMFDKDTSGEVPEHRDFIYDRLKPFCEKELGIKFTILHADKTYDDVFHHVITRGPHKGEVRGFAWAGMCAVNRDCKIPPVRKYNATLSPDTVSYVGKGNFYCSNKDCSFCLWEDNKFFSSKKKKLTKRIAKELLDKGWCRVTGLYTPKKPQLYDAVIRLDDSGGKYVSFKMELDK